MKYFVISSDGSKYGPFGVKELAELSFDGRVLPESILVEEDTGDQVLASNIIDFMPPVVSDMENQVKSLEQKAIEDKYNVYLIISFILIFIFPYAGVVTGLIAMRMEKEFAFGNPYASVAFWINLIISTILTIFIVFIVFSFFAMGAFMLD